MAVVGQVARPHGIRGHVFVNPETDFPDERFRVGATLFAMRDGAVEIFTVTASRIQQGRPVIALDGIDDMDQARELAGLEFRVPVDALTQLPDGMFYHHDLVGSRVETTDGMQVGTVAKVEGGSANSWLQVMGEKGEVLIPLTMAICTSIDPRAKRIVIAPPEGLLDVNSRRG